MSFNRLDYDTCEYKQRLSESIGPGDYMINKPPVNCEPCYPFSPSIRLQHSGDSVDMNQYMIDIDSEMLGITRKASKCPAKKYLPKCGQGSAGKLLSEKDVKNLTHWKDCGVPSEETRTSNPPCNLRGTGWNRWEWLCLNPQAKVEMPFDWNISNRIVVKDNHRPCVPTPISPEPLLPKGGSLQCVPTTPVCGVPSNPPSVHWQCAENLNKY